MNEAKFATNPGTRGEQIKSNEPIFDMMKAEEASKCSMFVARLNYLASDKFDIQYAMEEASKNMGQFQLRHWSLLQRIGKYAIDAPRIVQNF